MWQLDTGEMWVGDQLWHCSYLKTECKDTLTNTHTHKSPVPQSLLFFLKHKHRQPTQQQHTGEGVLPVSAWRDIMPQCQSDFQAGVIGECEKNVKGTWVAVQTHNIQKHTQVMQLCFLTAPVLYRHHPLLLASNPDIKKKGETGKREREWVRVRRSGTERRRIKRCTQARFMSLWCVMRLIC